MQLWEIEESCFAQGVKTIAGVDEAGRGPLAGPVCAAAVILPPELEIPGLNDSKKLTDAKRRELFDVICSSAVSYGIAFASEQEIDEHNILQATFLAMGRALAQLSVRPDLALIDGNRETDFGLPVKTVIKGDSLSANIAAASILAKVTRDRYMEQLALEYPGYGFEIHKGYGTKRHYAALDELGISPVHRMSFLKKYQAQQEAAASGRMRGQEPAQTE
ncbi:MAG: ribonuclease HII [Oscillospiraceae bacterium]|nr:ribonuclease HII [Oscillospiraceae bacterium]